MKSEPKSKAAPKKKRASKKVAAKKVANKAAPPPPARKSARSKLELCEALRDANVPMDYDKGEKDPRAIAWIKENCSNQEFENIYGGRVIPG